MTKIIGIAGSPRKKGNSTTLLKQVLKGAEDEGAKSQIIFLNDLTFKGCQNCDACMKTGKCAVRDELTPYYDDLRNADIWALASPIYYDSFTGQAKLFFDRLRCFSMEPGKLEGMRKAVVIVTYEDRRRTDSPDRWGGGIRMSEAICPRHGQRGHYLANGVPWDHRSPCDCTSIEANKDHPGSKWVRPPRTVAPLPPGNGAGATRT